MAYKIHLLKCFRLQNEDNATRRQSSESSVFEIDLIYIFKGAYLKKLETIKSCNFFSNSNSVYLNKTKKGKNIKQQKLI